MVHSEGKKGKKTKMLITSRVNFEMMKKMMTKESFYKKFEVAMNIVSEVLAEEMITNAYFEDSRMPSADEMKALKKEVWKF